MSDEQLRVLEQAAIANPTNPTKALAFVRALARSRERRLCGQGACQEEGEYLAASRSGFGFYCDEHRHKVTNDGSPEYVTTCPACGCMFGVN
jgi:hypothetical protein